MAEKVAWIKPGGKTQAGLDAEIARADRERREAEALAYLRETDYRIVRKAEEFLAAQGAIDQELLDARQAARDVINGGERV